MQLIMGEYILFINVSVYSELIVIKRIPYLLWSPIFFFEADIGVTIIIFYWACVYILHLNLNSCKFIV